MKIIRSFFAALFFAALLAAQGCARSERAEYDVAPFVLESLDGGTVDSADYFGKKTVLLNFWRTGCPACREEVPQLKRLWSAYGDKFALFAIDISDSKESIEKFAKSHAINYNIVLDKDGAVAESYGVFAIPTIVVVGIDGKVAYRGYNIFKAEKTLRRLLAEN